MALKYTIHGNMSTSKGISAPFISLLHLSAVEATPYLTVN